MKIDRIEEGRYISRPNRFTIEFYDKDNNIEYAHLHDPGRLKELLIEDRPILVRYSDNYEKTNRKTKYDFIAVKHENEWVLLNSGYHNQILRELIDNKNIDELKDYHVYKAEYTYGKSRLDFLLKDENDENLFLEVKGCTLVEDKVAKFPDAPTKRGTKHVNELINIKEDENNECAIVILILQNRVEYFTPNTTTDPDFSNTLEIAYNKNVMVLPTHILTKYEGNNLYLEYNKVIPIKFKNSKN